MRLRQPTIEDLLEAPTREGDPSTSFEAAGRVKVKEKQRLALEALLDLRRHNVAPVEAWRVDRKAGGRCSRYRLTRAGMAEAKEVRDGCQDD